MRAVEEGREAARRQPALDAFQHWTRRVQHLTLGELPEALVQGQAVFEALSSPSKRKESRMSSPHPIVEVIRTAAQRALLELTLCRQIAGLTPRVRGMLPYPPDWIKRATEIGRELADLSPQELASLAGRIRNPADHAEIRERLRRLRAEPRPDTELQELFALTLLPPPGIDDAAER